jgi:hypothetical protein
MRGLSRKWVWRCAEDITEAASRSDLPRKRLAARAINPPAAVLSCISSREGAELFGRQGQIFPHRGEGFAVSLFMRHGEHDQPRQQRLGLFVPMRV